MTHASKVTGAKVQETRAKRLQGDASVPDYVKNRGSFNNISPHLDGAGKDFKAGRPLHGLDNVGRAFDDLFSGVAGRLAHAAGELVGDKKLAQYGEKKWKGQEQTGMLEDGVNQAKKGVKAAGDFLKKHAGKPSDDWAQKALNNGN